MNYRKGRYPAGTPATRYSLSRHLLCLKAGPGTSFGYSNINYHLLALIIDSVTVSGHRAYITTKVIQGKDLQIIKIRGLFYKIMEEHRTLFEFKSSVINKETLTYKLYRLEINNPVLHYL